MSVLPTTRNGYLFGARRRKIPWESEGPDTGRRFEKGTPTRMAGQRSLLGVTPNQKDAPYGVGRGFVPQDDTAWEVEQDGPVAWQTFDDQLDPPPTRW